MKQVLQAISAFQKECPVIHEGTQGYGYSYASLLTILNTINPILETHGLGFTQLGQGDAIKTIIFHSSGEMIESVFNIPQNVSLKGQNEFQVLGSAITYLRRYALSSALGIVTDKDTDAGWKQTQPKPQSQQPPQQPISQQLDNSPAKPWFNPTNKDGSESEQGTQWIAYALKVGVEKATQATEGKYKVSKVSKKWMQNQNL